METKLDWTIRFLMQVLIIVSLLFNWHEVLPIFFLYTIALLIVAIFSIVSSALDKPSQGILDEYRLRLNNANIHYANLWLDITIILISLATSNFHFAAIWSLLFAHTFCLLYLLKQRGYIT